MRAKNENESYEEYQAYRLEEILLEGGRWPFWCQNFSVTPSRIDGKLVLQVTIDCVSQGRNIANQINEVVGLVKDSNRSEFATRVTFR